MVVPKEPGDAKYHRYERRGGSPGSDGGTGVAHVIHAVGPDFRRLHDPPGTPPHSRAEVVATLARAYGNILREFAASGQRRLRLLPVSGGIFAGPFAAEVPALTWEALQLGFGRLSLAERRAVQRRAVDLCLFDHADLARFRAAGFPAAAPEEEGTSV